MSFAPLDFRDGYLPLEDHGLIGDGSTAALVGRDGAVSWMCLTRFDSPPVFCRILDRRSGGAFTIAPEGLLESRQYYAGDTAILVTEMRAQTGAMRLTDMFTLQSGVDLTEAAPATRRELLRSVEVLEGELNLIVDITPRGRAHHEWHGGGIHIDAANGGDLNLHLSADIPLGGPRTIARLGSGGRANFLLRWGGGYRRNTFEPEALARATHDGWGRWIQRFAYSGPQQPLVRRSALTLKLLEHFDSGAILAAPSSSLPEAIGGPRNWDYRYSWVRDAAFMVYALHRIGFSPEAAGFLSWVLDAFERGGSPKVLYTIDGAAPAPERQDPELEGYRGSRPVRWGNGAAEQIQHDVYGEILDCAYQFAAHHGQIDAPLWERLKGLVTSARSLWRMPDQGIWEVRTQGRPFTYSAAMCEVALDRAARMAARFALNGDVDAWRAGSDQIRRAILEESWDEKLQSLTEHLGGGGLDASLLALPLRRVIPADHPRMVATTTAIEKRLGAGNGLLYRYLPSESPDGVGGEEGAFLLCSFWMVDNFAYQGKIDSAMEMYDSLCARANPLGLLPEQIDPSSGTFLGNFPQGFSHVGVISSGVNLARRIQEKRGGAG